jgi:imidazolonepropionase-like amidohydrolase
MTRSAYFRSAAGLLLSLLACCAHAQQARPASFAQETRQFIKYDAPLIALTHVRVIDGTGAAAFDDRTVVIRAGKLDAIGPSATLRPPKDAVVLDRAGYTVFPGLVGMHDHLFDVPPRNDFANWTFLPAPLTAPRLYLAHGVTTIRSTGTVAFNIDLGLKRAIDAGKTPGPRINVTAPFLVDASAASGMYWGLKGPEDARRVVRFFAEAGAESFKVYQWITREELVAVIDEAHKHGIKVTGHLCSLTHREAAELGIDNIEHGFSFMTDFTPNKKADECPMPGGKPVSADQPEFQDLARYLAQKNVAITSTIALEEMFMRPEPVTDEYLSYLTTDTRWQYLKRRARNEPMFPGAPSGDGGAAIRREVRRLRAFVDAGGLLMIGPDAIGPDLIKGHADLRGVELLVEGGFTPLEAIKVASLNGARFLGMERNLGSLEAGKIADLVLVKGNPAARIADIHNIEIVFKDGVGYDPARLKDSVRGQMGLR